MPQCCWRTARTMATRDESSPDVVRRGRSAAVRVTSAWTSASNGRRPSMVTATQVPGTCCWWFSTNRPVGSVTAEMPSWDEVEAADLVDGAEPVLHGPDHPEARVAVALEVQYDVDDVLEHAGPGDRAVLGDVADEDGGDVAGLGHPDQGRRHLLDLGDAAGHPLEVGGTDRLDGVDDQQARSHLVDVGQDGAEVGLGREVELVVDPAGPVGPEPDLGRRLLAGDVEGASLVAGRLGGHLQQEGALADAGLSGEKDGRARHQPSAEHPVELGHPAGAERRLLHRHLPDRHGGPAHRRGRGPGGRRGQLGDRPPGLALTAPAHPLGGLPAALAAPECGSDCLGHGRNARARVRQAPV